MNKKYSNLLTIILILIIIAIVAIIGFLGFKYYQTYIIKSEAEDFVEVWGKDEHNNKKPNKNDGSVIPPNEDKDDNDNLFDGVEDGTNTNDSGTEGNTQKFNGFEIAEKQGFKENGYRVIVNCGKDGGQEVGHLHFHLLAGKQLGEKIV